MCKTANSNKKYHHSRLNGVTIWDGSRKQRSECASTLRYVTNVSKFSILFGAILGLLIPLLILMNTTIRELKTCRNKYDELFNLFLHTKPFFFACTSQEISTVLAQGNADNNFRFHSLSSCYRPQIQSFSCP
jgi:hypothetical protein